MSTQNLNILRVRSAAEADCDAIIVTLYRAESRIRGWYVGPVSMMRAGLSVPYVPRSKRMIGEHAVIQAHRLAAEQTIPVCIVNPDDLWPEMWGSRR